MASPIEVTKSGLAGNYNLGISSSDDTVIVDQSTVSRNGVVEQTFALGPGSIAIDAIPADVRSSYTYSDGCSMNTDERGVSRLR